MLVYHEKYLINDFLQIKSMFKCCFSDRKSQIFLLGKAYFADVASSYIEKIQRSIAEKDGFGGRIIIFKHTLRPAKIEKSLRKRGII